MCCNNSGTANIKIHTLLVFQTGTRKGDQSKFNLVMTTTRRLFVEESTCLLLLERRGSFLGHAPLLS